MKIGIIAINEHPVQKNTAYGIEAFTYALVEGLARRNHKVTLFASGESKVSCPIESVHPIGIGLDSAINPKLYHYYHNWLYQKAFSQKKYFDILHGQDPTLSLLYSSLFNKPTAATFHSPILGHRYSLDIFRQFQDLNAISFVTVSRFQQKQLAPYFPNVTAIHNSVDINNPAINPIYSTTNDYIFYLGRMSPQKGLGLVFDVSKKLNRKVLFSGYAATDEEVRYFESVVKPILSASSNNISIISNIIGDNKFSYFARAKVFLFPVLREEPFGITMVESMATGTPVVAFARGSVPEVIKDGETGFIVNSSPSDIRGSFIIKKAGIDGLCEAVEKIYSMPEEEYRQMRRNCRSHVEKNFTVERMVSNYEKVYQQILQTKK